MPMHPRVAIALVAVPVSFAVACNPSDCQGAGFVTDQPVVDVIDDKGAFPLCVGDNTTVEGDLNISNQQQLIDASSCKVVIGNVIVLNSDDIVDLAPLAGLTNIDQGYFLAFNNTALEQIDLPNVETIAYGIGVIDNPALSSVAFPSIIEATGDITVRNNAVLTNLAFDGMTAIRNDARFAGNVDNAGNLIVGENPAFTGFQSFANLEIIEGFFSVFANDALVNFEGLENLNQINNFGNNPQAFEVGIDIDEEQNIIAAGNASLQDFTGLGDLEIVAGDIFIGFNPELQSFTGLDDLREHADDIFIVQNDSLVDLNGLNGDGGDDLEDDGLQVVNGSLFIGQFFDKLGQPVAGGNPALEDLTGLNNLVQLDGSLVLAFNNNINDLNGLDILPAIGGDFVVVGTIEDFDGADALATIGGDLVLGRVFGNDDKVLNPVLDVNDQAVATDFNANLDIAGDETDLDALTTVGGDVVVAFANVDNLRIGGDAFTTIGGSLIVHNTNLADFQGLESVNALGGLVIGLAVDKNGDLDAIVGEVGAEVPTGNNDFEDFDGLNVTDLGVGGFALGPNENLDDAGLATSPINGTVQGDVTFADTEFQTLNGLDVAVIGGNFNVGAIRNSNSEPVDQTNENLDALGNSALTQVNGDVLIAFNDNLTDVAMAALTTVGGSFEITGNNALELIDGVNLLNIVGDLRIHDLPALANMNLQGLANVNGDFFLVRNPQLDTVNLVALGDIDGNAEITDLGSLQNLDFLSNLDTVGDIAAAAGDFIIQDNAQIADIDGLAGLQTVGGDLVLARNPGVENLDLDALGQVGGSFELNDMNGLVDLTNALDQSLPLVAVGDALRVKNNVNLETLKGLENLVTIGLTLSIVNNLVLETVLIDDGVDDVVDEADDQGLVVLETVGNADFDDDQPTGDRGVIEAQNNPQLDENQLDDVIADLNGFDIEEDFVLFCGNQNQVIPGSLAACGNVGAEEE